MEWQGALTRTAISKDGVVNEKDSGNWNASDAYSACCKKNLGNNSRC